MRISCSICLEDSTDNSKMVALPCGHVFDETCILECYQISRQCPICKRSQGEGSVQLYRRLFFSVSGENRSDADTLLIQSLKARLERLEAIAKENASTQNSTKTTNKFSQLYLDYETKDRELIEAVTKLSLVTAANERLQESNATLRSNLLKAHKEIKADKADKERLTMQLNAMQVQLNYKKTPSTSREQNRTISDLQNIALSRKEQQASVQLAKAEEELVSQRSRITDLEAKCKILSNINSSLQERQNNRASSSSSQRRPNNTNRNILYEDRIKVLEAELASIKTQRNRHHREATKQKKKAVNLEKQTEEMAHVISILDTLIERGDLHILNQPSSSRRQMRATAHQGWL